MREFIPFILFVVAVGIYEQSPRRAVVPDYYNSSLTKAQELQVSSLLNAPEYTQFSPSFLNPQRKIRIAVLDTGVDFSHMLLKEYKSNKNQLVNSFDEIGHGTQVAGVIVSHLQTVYGTSASKMVEIESFKYEPNNLASYLKALEAAVNSAPTILNISSSGFGQHPVERMLLSAASSMQIITIVAAGNDQSGDPRYPCSYNMVICVGNIDNLGNLVLSSNFGPHVHVYAQGYEVFTSAPGNRWTTATGTSFSAPLITAQVASLMINPAADSYFDSKITMNPRAWWVPNSMRGPASK